MLQTATAHNKSNQNTDYEYNTDKSEAEELKHTFDRINKEPVNLRPKSKTSVLKNTAGTLKKAYDVEPSAALKTILKAIQNGTFTLPESQKEDYKLWSDPFTKVYTSQDNSNIYDMTVLDSGSDIFLSLGYSPLTKEDSQKDLKSQRIQDLISVIEIIDRTAKKNATMSTKKAELDRKRAQLRAYTQRPRQHSKTILDFLGIKRDRAGGNYEELTQSYQNYKAWTERMEKLDNYLKKKRRKRILKTPKTPKGLKYRQPELEKISP